MTRKLGILGGTFNPIHYGHLAIARAAQKAHALERVLFVPAARPPHKATDLAPAADRLAMVQLAVATEENLEASAIEIDRPGVSYTVDTLEELSRRYAGSELFFIVGADSVPELRSWWRLARILELARLVVVNRQGCAAELAREDFPGIPQAVLDRCERDAVYMEPVPLSSTLIREAARRGETLAGKVPVEVEHFLTEHGLYR